MHFIFLTREVHHACNSMLGIKGYDYNTTNSSPRVDTCWNIGRNGCSALGRHKPGTRTGTPWNWIRSVKISCRTYLTVENLWKENCSNIFSEQAEKYRHICNIINAEVQSSTFLLLRSLSLAVETASRTNFICVGSCSFGTEPTTLENASQAACWPL